MDLMTHAGASEALDLVHRLWLAVREAQQRSTGSHSERLGRMLNHLAALDSELQSWLGVWEGQR